MCAFAFGPVGRSITRIVISHLVDEITLHGGVSVPIRDSYS